MCANWSCSHNSVCLCVFFKYIKESFPFIHCIASAYSFPWAEVSPKAIGRNERHLFSDNTFKCKCFSVWTVQWILKSLNCICKFYRFKFNITWENYDYFFNDLFKYIKSFFLFVGVRYYFLILCVWLYARCCFSSSPINGIIIYRFLWEFK